MRYLAGLLAALVCCACAGSVQTPIATVEPGGEPPASALFREIADQDARLSAAFNAHDLTALMGLFSEDLEFYHDAGGLQTYKDVKEAFGGLFARNDGIRRELVPGTLRVFPIKGYGAVELGSHRFCHRENGRDDCGAFEFLQLWKREEGSWKLTRVVSYGH